MLKKESYLTLLLTFHVIFVNLPVVNNLDDGEGSSDGEMAFACQIFSTTYDTDCNLSTIQSYLGTPLATPGEMPFMISLQDYQYDLPFHFCGGIIIDNEWVLTTAFCINSYKKSQIKVTAGEIDTTIADKEEQVVEVEKIILHESFSIASQYRNNDIALMKVNPPLNFTGLVNKAKLGRRRKDNHVGKICQTYGWGMANKRMLMSPMLKVANLTVIAREDCVFVYPWLGRMRGSICAVSQPLQGPCMGDWGSPLICGHGDEREVIGLASWSNGCGDENYPAVFVDVRKYNHWIQSTIKLHEKNKAQ